MPSASCYRNAEAQARKSNIFNLSKFARFSYARCGHMGMVHTPGVFQTQRQGDIVGSLFVTHGRWKERVAGSPLERPSAGVFSPSRLGWLIGEGSGGLAAAAVRRSGAGTPPRLVRLGCVTFTSARPQSRSGGTGVPDQRKCGGDTPGMPPVWHCQLHKAVRHERGRGSRMRHSVALRNDDRRRTDALVSASWIIAL